MSLAVKLEDVSRMIAERHAIREGLGFCQEKRIEEYTRSFHLIQECAVAIYIGKITGPGVEKIIKFLKT